MAQCHVCETDVDDDASTCLQGHVLEHGAGGVVMPVGDGNGGIVRPSGEETMRLVTLERSASEGLLSEALGALAEDIRRAEPKPDCAAEPERSAGESADVTAREPAGPAGFEDRFPTEDDPMLVSPETQHGPADDGDGDDRRAADEGALLAAELFGKPMRPTTHSRKPMMIPVLVLAVLAGAGAFVVFGGGDAEAATYRRMFTPKETHRYSFAITMDGEVEAGPVREPMKMRVEMTLTEQTIAVDAGGVATIRQTIDSMAMDVNGAPAPIPDLEGLAITVRMAPDGTLLGVEGLESLGFGQAGPATDLLGPNAFGPLLPSEAVAPGDEWTIIEQLPTPFGKPMKLTARNRLVHRGTDGGVETALIRSNIDLPMNMRVGIDEVLAAAGDGGGLADLAGIPKGAEFVYDGGMRMELLQTVVVATGRPLTVSGSGTGDIEMSITGVRGMPSMRMTFSISATMAEIPGAKRTGGSRFADPVLTA